jgi:hypothetical protein
VNNDQIVRLRESLHNDTRHIEPVGLGVETVQRRGRRRQHRGRAIVAAGAATCIAGLGVAVTSRGTAPHSVAVVAGNASAATPTLSFRTVNGTVAYASTHLTGADGVTYALATAPGTNASEATQAIYRTTDGDKWTETTQSTPWISDLAERDGVLYAVGTAPGAASIDQVKYQVATSRNGGAAWADTDLPFDLQAPNASVALSRSGGVQIARGASSTVALLTEQFSPDLDALIAARAPGHPEAGTTQTADGFDITDYSACKDAKMAVARGDLDPSGADAKCAPKVLGTISWSDIGVHGAADLTRQQMLVSTDGSHWDPVSAPTVGWVRDLVGTDDGFLLLAESAATPTPEKPRASLTLLHSSDAHTWSPVATPAGVDVQAISGNKLIAVDDNGGVQTSADGGATWSTTDVKALLPAGAVKPSVWSSDAGPLGFAALVTSDANDQQSARHYLLFSTDGVDWNTSDLAAAGEPAHTEPMQVTVGADHVGVDYATPAANPGGPMTIKTLLGTPSGSRALKERNQQAAPCGWATSTTYAEAWMSTSSPTCTGPPAVTAA